MKFFPLIWKNLMRSKRRTVLTVLSLAVLTLLLAVILSIYEWFVTSPTGAGQELRLWVQHNTSLANLLPETHAQKIKQIPGVTQVCMSSWFGGQYGTDPTDAKNWFGRFAVQTETAFECFKEIKITDDYKQAFINDPQGGIAGKRLVEKQGWKIGDKIVFRGDYYPCNPELYLRGIFVSADPRDEENFWFHRKYFEEMLDRPGKTATILVLCDSTSAQARIASEIDSMFANSEGPTRTMTEREFYLSFTEMMGNIKVILFSVCFAILVVMILVTSNTIAMGTRERTTETAVMKTLGFVRGHILAMVMSEAALMAITGSLVGIALADFLLSGMGQIGWIAGATVSSLSIIISLVCAILVGVLSAGIPAYHLGSIRIIDGLRRVG